MKHILYSRARITLFLLCCLIALTTEFVPPPIPIHGKDTESDFFIGALEPGNSERRLNLKIDDGKAPDIRVVNIGKENMVMSSTYGESGNWKYHIQTSNPFKPGADVTLDSGNKAGPTCLTPYAPEKNKRRGIYYAVRGFDRTGRLSYPNPKTTAGLSFDFDAVSLTRLFLNMEVIGRIADKIPIPGVGFAIQVLIDIFLPPPAEKSAWDQVKDNVRKEIKESQFVVIELILKSDIKPLRKQVKEVYEELSDADGDIDEARGLYLNLAQRFTGYETKFQFEESGKNLDNKEVNYRILPLFVRVVNLKLAYYEFGLAYKDKLKLPAGAVRRLQKQIEATVKGAIKHVTDTEQGMIDITYDKKNPNDLFNDMMRIRSFVGVAAMEYYDDWAKYISKKVDKNPKPNDREENNAVIYSEYFGRTTPNLYLEPLVSFGKAPLTPPKLPSKDVARLEGLQIFESKPGFISGIRLKFEGNKNSKLGSDKGPSKELKIGKEYITKMDVGGDGKLEFMIVHLSDGRTEKYGRGFKAHLKTFELKDHYIASMVAFNDDVKLNGQFANIAVSYRLIPTKAVGKVPKQFDKKKNA